MAVRLLVAGLALGNLLRASDWASIGHIGARLWRAIDWRYHFHRVSMACAVVSTIILNLWNWPGAQFVVVWLPAAAATVLFIFTVGAVVFGLVAPSHRQHISTNIGMAVATYVVSISVWKIIPNDNQSAIYVLPAVIALLAAYSFFIYAIDAGVQTLALLHQEAII